jgi:hypothetical protein
VDAASFFLEEVIQEKFYVRRYLVQNRIGSNKKDETAGTISSF